jgi:hypothetical protein
VRPEWREVQLESERTWNHEECRSGIDQEVEGRSATRGTRQAPATRN